MKCTHNYCVYDFMQISSSGKVDRISRLYPIFKLLKLYWKEPLLLRFQDIYAGINKQKWCNLDDGILIKKHPKSV